MAAGATLTMFLGVFLLPYTPLGVLLLMLGVLTMAVVVVFVVRKKS